MDNNNLNKNDLQKKKGNSAMKKNNKQILQTAAMNYIREENTETPELIFNLSYTYDANGFILKLFVKEHTIAGSREDKLAFLKRQKEKSYMTSEEFDIPEKFHVFMAMYKTDPVHLNVSHISIMEHTDGGRNLFGDAIDKIKEKYAFEPNVLINEFPVIYITPRFLNVECQLLLPVDSINLLFPEL